MMFNPYFPNVLPTQQVLQANGRASVEAIKLSPNSSVLILDTTAPLVWLCVSDSLGNVSSTPYEIKAYVDPAEAKKQGMDERLSALEENVKKIMEVLTDESNGGGSKSKQNDRNNEPDTAD